MARILVFAFDLTEASQIRRIRSLKMLGHDVISAAFRRGNMNAQFTPDWANIDLGFVANESYCKRIIGILRAIRIVVRKRDALKSVDLLIARNFDLLVVAWAAKSLCGMRDVPLVYECLDIHGLFTKSGPVGTVMRWCERRLLARTQLLIVSSPGFVTHYFAAIQKYRGPHNIVENKLWFDGPPVPRPKRRTPGAVLALGWVGSIRCAPSLKVLMQAADHFGDRITLRIHGNVHRHAVPDFDDEIAKRDNVAYFGTYDYPTGLADVYAGCDLVWAQDLWQRGANSDWLLPNRIYEASWFGCPSIAVADTETGRKVAADGLGFTIDQPTAGALIDLLGNRDRDRIEEISQRLLAMDDVRFMLRPADIQDALTPVMQEED